MAQDEKTIIRSLLEPKIILDELSLDDVFKGTSNLLPDSKKGQVTGHQEQHSLGTEYPFISINQYVISLEELAYFEIDCTGFLPRLHLEFNMLNTTVFTSQGMPKDGDLINIFIRAKNDSFKPVRNDYVITGVRVGRGGQEGMGATVTIDAELFIPRIRDEVVKSYKGTSREVLLQICKDLKLGFATNETSTDDSQVWVCPGDSTYNLLNHIIDHSWKTPKDFYKGYIDVYYHLNFVNVNNQFEGNDTLAAGLLDSTLFKDYFANEADNVQNQQTEIPKMLTNLENFRETNFYIEQFKVVNNSSQVAKKYGYKSHVQFFDLKSLKYWDLYIDPITTEGAEKEKIILKGRTFPKKANSQEKGAPSQEDYWKTQNKKEWLGIQSKNVHDNYLLSEVQNKRNRVELEKMYLEVDIPRWNPNIYNGEKVPIVLLNLTDDKKKSADAIGESAEAPRNSDVPSVDQIKTGFYMTDGIRFLFTRNGPAGSFDSSTPPREYPTPHFNQTLILRRREWPAP